MAATVITETTRRLVPRYWFLLGAMGCLAGAAALGEDDQVAVGLAVSLVSFTLAGRGIYRSRPEAAKAWWTVATGSFAFLIGACVAATDTEAGGAPPFPSPADAFFLAGYVLLIVGALALLRHRKVEREDDGRLEAILVAAAIGVVALTYVGVPYLLDPAFTLVEKTLTLVYEMADVALVAITARIAMGAERRPTSYYLVAASLAAVVVTDALVTLHGSGVITAAWVAVVAPLGHVLFAAAALDPSIARLTDRPEARNLAPLSRGRLVLLFSALLLVPGLLAVHVVTGRQMAAVPVLAGGSVVMALLVVLRLVDLVRANERAARRDMALSVVGARLVAATTREELHRAAMEGLSAVIASTRGPARGSLSVSSAGALVVMASVGHRSDEAVGRVVAFDQLPDGSCIALGVLRTLVSTVMAPLDLPQSDEGRVSIVAVPLSSRGVLCGVLMATAQGRLPPRAALVIEDLARQVSLALERADLNEEIHQRRQERRFKALVEHSSDLIGVVGRQGLLTFVSPASKDLLGRAPTSLVGQPALELVHPDDRRKVAAMRRRARASGGAPEPVELRVLHADGWWRWCEVVVSDAFDEPEVAGLVIHARDVTERKAAELRVVESEARFRSLVQNATDLVMVVDPDWMLAYVSPSVTRILGQHAADVLGTPWLGLFERDDVAHAARVVGATERDRPATIELRARGASGLPVHLEMTVSDLRHDPAVAGLVMNGRDITERRHSEERWRAFGIESSHQLRTPITGLRLRLEHLLGQPSVNPGALDGALADVERLERTVEDFLALAPRRLPVAGQLDLRAVLGDVDAAWRNAVESSGRHLDVAVHDPIPMVRASGAAIRQILGVLIENALRHGQGRIAVVARELAGGLAVEVSDEGTGLVGSGGLRRSKHEGHGIGLTLARSLAVAEGGRLVIRRSGRSPALAVVLPAPPTSAAGELRVEPIARAANRGDVGGAPAFGELVTQGGDVHVESLG